MIAVVIAVAVIVGVTAFVVGFGCRVRSEIRSRLREVGLTHQSARLYGRAAKLLNRLVRVTELDGVFAADNLSEATRKDIEQWIDDYRKEISKP